MKASSTEYLGVLPDMESNSSRVEEALASLNFNLERLGTFYDGIAYGAYKVCYGERLTDGTFVCDTGSMKLIETTFANGLSIWREPGRLASIWEVSEVSKPDSKGIMLAFDFSRIDQEESAMGMSLIFFIIVVMVSFGLVLSSNINTIALVPLERMLAMVRSHCHDIFKFTEELQEQDSNPEAEKDNDEEFDDTEQSSEFELLKKVVEKLAAIAQLTSKNNDPASLDNLTEDQVITLNYMGGAQTVTPVGGASAKARQSVRNSCFPVSPAAGSPRETHTPRLDTPRKEALSTQEPVVSHEIATSLRTPYFNSIEVTKEVQCAVSTYIIDSFEGSTEWVRSNVPEAQLRCFVSIAESGYKPNHFHNFAHGVDVLYAVARFMRLVEAHRFISETLQFGLLIAGLSHDLGHFGVNNQYLVETSHELSIRYNDRSPLENMHCSELFRILTKPEANVFEQLEKDLYKEMRKALIEAILHTDITFHNGMVKDLSILFQMNSGECDRQDTPREFGSQGTEPTTVAVTILAEPQYTQLMLNAFLHTADVGNPMKPWELTLQMANLCIDEFFAQGDLEKAAGIPVQMLNDRDKVNRPTSQVGFVEFVIAPLCVSMVQLFPVLDDLAENLGENIKHWAELWVEQTNPDEEAAAKTRSRAEKVATKCQALKRRPSQAVADG